MPRVSKAKGEAPKLPNAPLTEVVFELRWKLSAEEDGSSTLPADPGYRACLDSFVGAAERLGFAVARRVSQGPFELGYSVDFRFFKGPESRFPILQLGPGIFAANESTDYSWPDYKTHCVNGIRALLASYPKMKRFDFQPTQIQLKYIDAFKPKDGKSIDYLAFLRESTHIDVGFPAFLQDRRFGVPDSGRVSLAFPVSKMNDTNFAFVFANGLVSQVPCVVLETNVTTMLPESRKTRFGPEFVSSWLEQAHDLTSPFFKSVVKQSLMKQFLRNSDE